MCRDKCVEDAYNGENVNGENVNGEDVDTASAVQRNHTVPSSYHHWQSQRKDSGKSGMATNTKIAHIATQCNAYSRTFQNQCLHKGDAHNGQNVSKLNK